MRQSPCSQVPRLLPLMCRVFYHSGAASSTAYILTYPRACVRLWALAVGLTLTLTRTLTLTLTLALTLMFLVSNPLSIQFSGRPFPSHRSLYPFHPTPTRAPTPNSNPNPSPYTSASLQGDLSRLATG